MMWNLAMTILRLTCRNTKPKCLFGSNLLGTLLGFSPLIIYMKERLGTLLGLGPLIIYMKERPSATTYLYLGLLARNFIF
jgi:hypothetical protein